MFIVTCFLKRNKRKTSTWCALIYPKWSRLVLQNTLGSRTSNLPAKTNLHFLQHEFLFLPVSVFIFHQRQVYFLERVYISPSFLFRWIFYILICLLHEHPSDWRYGPFTRTNLIWYSKFVISLSTIYKVHEPLCLTVEFIW